MAPLRSHHHPALRALVFAVRERVPRPRRNDARIGSAGDHSTICRWVHHDAPQLEQRVRAQWKPTTDSWRVDETYISYLTARRTLQGYEAMNQLRKGQVHGITKGDIGSQNALSPRPL